MRRGGRPEPQWMGYWGLREPPIYRLGFVHVDVLWQEAALSIKIALVEQRAFGAFICMEACSSHDLTLGSRQVSFFVGSCKLRCAFQNRTVPKFNFGLLGLHVSPDVTRCNKFFSHT
jgi:hypothetical protein